MPFKNKPSFTLPRKQEMHVCFPRVMRIRNQSEESKLHTTSKISESSIGTRPKRADFRYAPYVTDPQLLLRSRHSEDFEDDSVISDGADDTSDTAKADEGTDSSSLRSFTSIPMPDWSTRQLARSPQQSVDEAQALQMMKTITLNDFESNWRPIEFSSSVSLAKHLSTVEDRVIEPTELLLMAVRNFWFDSLQLKIGNEFIHVDRYLFSYYMNTFKDLTNNMLDLPRHKAPMHLLVKLYKWIISDDVELEVGDDFLHIYMMAKYLDVRYLLEQYWHAISVGGKLGLWEEEAFNAYLPSRQLNCGDLMTVFLGRIRKCFLPLVASSEFVEFDASELIFLLKSDTVCVNSEDEIFFAAIRWLEYDWPKRAHFVVPLMATVRFRLLSPWLQRSITFKPENKVIGYVGSNPVVKAMLWQACLYGEASSAFLEDPECIDSPIFDNFSDINDSERHWVFCSGVPHQHDIKCPYFRQLTYNTFKIFLNLMQSNAYIFMEDIKFVPYKHWHTYKCCEDSDESQTEMKFVRSPVYKL